MEGVLSLLLSLFLIHVPLQQHSIIYWVNKLNFFWPPAPPFHLGRRSNEVCIELSLLLPPFGNIVTHSGLNPASVMWPFNRHLMRFGYLENLVKIVEKFLLLFTNIQRISWILLAYINANEWYWQKCLFSEQRVQPGFHIRRIEGISVQKHLHDQFIFLFHCWSAFH